MCLSGGQQIQKHSAGPAQVFLLERCQHTGVKLLGVMLFALIRVLLFATAWHDFPPVRLRPCGSGSCRCCNGEKKNIYIHTFFIKNLQTPTAPKHQTVFLSYKILALNIPLFTKSKRCAEVHCCGTNKLHICHNCSMCTGARNKKKTWMREKAFYHSGKDCDSLPTLVGGARHVMLVVMETAKKKGAVTVGSITQ